MLNLYITSTEKNEHRYLVISGLAGVMQSLGYDVCVYKPIQTDCIFEHNQIRSIEFNHLIKTDSFIDIKSSYMFQKAANPLLASVGEGKLIEREQLCKDFKELSETYECLIVNGTDGPGTPLNMNFLESDMIKDFNLPVLFIVSALNTSTNNILSTINGILETGITVRGIVITDYPDNTEDEDIKFMPRFIEEYTTAKILGILPKINEHISPEDLIDLVLNGIDIEAIFDVQIAKLEK